MTPAIEYASFLVRLWQEATPPLEGEEKGGEVSEWHGEVEHIQSGRRWAFSSLDEVLAFLRQQARGTDAFSPPPDE